MYPLQPDRIAALLRELLQGREISEERIDERLEGVGAPFRCQGVFLLLLCRVSAAGERVISETERNLYDLAVDKLVADAAGDSYCVPMLRESGELLVGLLSLPDSWDRTRAEPFMAGVRSALEAKTADQPFTAMWESSPAFSSLTQLASVYETCREEMRSRVYQAESARGGETAEESEWRFYAPSRQFVQDALQGRLEQAEVLFQRILEAAELDAGESPSRFHALAQAWMDSVMEQIVAANLSQPNKKELLESCGRWTDAVPGDCPPEEQAGKLTALLRRLSQELSQCGRKKQYRYIQSAKTYIAEHYAQSSLSLNEISDNIGISPSYLSLLFKEYEQDNFSSYLASYRVEQSKLLLDSTNLSANNIGFACGFNSSQNYFRVFKKCTGMSPGQYRIREEKS